MSEQPLVQTASAIPPATLADMIAEWEERLYQERNAERVARQHDETFAKWHEGRADTYDRIIDEAKRYVTTETALKARVAQLEEALRNLLKAVNEPKMLPGSQEIGPPDYASIHDHELARCIWEARAALATKETP
jgi:Zn-dependent M32 family carboxypeptidase